MGPPKFFDVSLPACHSLRTPADLHILALTDASCWLRETLKPSPSATSSFRSCTNFQGTRLPLRPTGFSVYASPVLFGYSPSASATGATLDTGGWLALTRPGLSPGKIRQAYLGATTLCITGRRRAKRGGYPTAGPLLGAPVHAVVRRPPAKNHGFETDHWQPSLPLHYSSIRRASLACCPVRDSAYHLPSNTETASAFRRPRCTAPARLPLSAGSDFDGEEVLSTPTLDSVCVPLRFTQPRTPRWGTTDVHYCRACQFQPSVMRRLRASRTGLMSPQELASRASNYRPVRAARNPRTTIGPFAASATTGSATRACIPETLLLPAPPQDAERIGSYPSCDSMTDKIC